MDTVDNAVVIERLQRRIAADAGTIAVLGAALDQCVAERDALRAQVDAASPPPRGESAPTAS